MQVICSVRYECAVRFGLTAKKLFSVGKLNVKVGAGLLNLMDEPHLIGASGARYFDSEGVATERRSIFEEGVLKTYFIDTYNSKKMGVEPTVNSPSLLVLKPGSKDLNGLVADVQKGILVTGSMAVIVTVAPETFRTV